MVSGKFLTLDVCEQPTKRQVFDDSDYWLLPDTGVPEVSADSEIITGIQTEAEADQQV